MFGSVFLLPALGISLMIACGVGLASMVVYVGYLITYTVLDMIWRQSNTREVQRLIREAKQRARESGRQTNS